MKIKKFLKELKDSSHKQQFVFTQGSCFRLYCILKTLFPCAKPYYSGIDGHWVTEIKGKFYDINGEIDTKYVEFKNYEHITDKITLSSAYIPTYKGQTSSYSKYI